MTDDELRALVAQNSQTAAANQQAIANTQQALDRLIIEVIRPLSERTSELEERAQENQVRSIENAELFRTLLAEAREDRIRNQQRFDAQQEVIRSLLLRVTTLNEGSGGQSEEPLEG